MLLANRRGLNLFIPDLELTRVLFKGSLHNRRSYEPGETNVAFARLALHAKCRVRLASLIKRLLCRLIQGGDPYDAENVLYSMSLYLGTKLNPLIA